MNSEKTAPLMALRRFSCLSAALATNPEDSVAVCIGGSPMTLVAAGGVALFMRLTSFLWIKQTPQSGNQLFRLDDLSIQPAALGGSRLAGVENSQSALKALLIDHAALAQPFKFPGLALNVRLRD